MPCGAKGRGRSAWSGVSDLRWLRLTETIGELVLYSRIHTVLYGEYYIHAGGQISLEISGIVFSFEGSDFQENF